MKRAIFKSLALAATVTAAFMIWASAAWAPPRAGSNARTVLNDVIVCQIGGVFQVAYESSAGERPNRILIKTETGRTIVDRRITLRNRTVTFPGLTLPDGSDDPFGGTRSLSGFFPFLWRPLAVGTRLQVTIFGVADVPPGEGEVFPTPGTPDIVVSRCFGANHHG